HLVRVADGKELAQLSFREQTRFLPLSFSPDGGELVVLDHNAGEVMVWDLRTLRAELAELGLDWDAPRLPAARRDALPPITHVTFLRPDLATNPEKLRQYQRGETVLQLWANPLNADAQARLGKQLRGENQVDAALVHLNIALALEPERLDARWE